MFGLLTRQVASSFCIAYVLERFKRNVFAMVMFAAKMTAQWTDLFSSH